MIVYNLVKSNGEKTERSTIMKKLIITGRGGKLSPEAFVRLKYEMPTLLCLTRDIVTKETTEVDEQLKMLKWVRPHKVFTPNEKYKEKTKAEFIAEKGLERYIGLCDEPEMIYIKTALEDTTEEEKKRTEQEFNMYKNMICKLNGRFWLFEELPEKSRKQWSLGTIGVTEYKLDDMGNMTRTIVNNAFQPKKTTIGI